jgi:hypothetical protein
MHEKIYRRNLCCANGHTGGIRYPGRGAANAVWKDEQSGIIVDQSNPRNTVESYFHLMDRESYDAAVLLFEPAVHENINGDLLKASQEYNGWSMRNW